MPAQFAVVPVDAEVETDEVPAATGSPLAGLRARRDAMRAKRVLDLLIPGYEAPEELCVRFRALTPGEIDAITTRHEKAKTSEKVNRISASLIAKAAVAIFNVDPESREPVGDPSQWSNFTGGAAGDLAAALDVKLSPETGAMDLVNALYGDEGSIFAVANQLTGWSAHSDEDFSRELPKA